MTEARRNWTNGFISGFGVGISFTALLVMAAQTFVK